MVTKHKQTKQEWAQSILLVLLAIGVVVVFFNLDIMRKGKSVFSMTAEKKIKFKGDLDRKDYTDREFDQLLKFIKRHDDLIDSATVEVSIQDSYKKVSGSSPMIFEVQLRMSDGATITTPTRRTTRKVLIPDILTKLAKDMRAYKKLIKEGKKVNSLVNTM